MGRAAVETSPEECWADEEKAMTLFRSIAVAQTCPLKGDVNANLDEHRRLIEVAASEGAQIIVSQNCP